MKKSDNLKRLEFLEAQIAREVDKILDQTLYNTTGDTPPDWQELINRPTPPSMEEILIYIKNKALENCDTKIVEEYIEFYS